MCCYLPQGKIECYGILQNSHPRSPTIECGGILRGMPQPWVTGSLPPKACFLTPNGGVGGSRWPLPINTLGSLQDLVS